MTIFLAKNYTQIKKRTSSTTKTTDSWIFEYRTIGKESLCLQYKLKQRDKLLPGSAQIMPGHSVRQLTFPSVPHRATLYCHALLQYFFENHLHILHHSMKKRLPILVISGVTWRVEWRETCRIILHRSAFRDKILALPHRIFAK